ncbi:MAG: hypothetical protein FWF50_05875 [Defluviitaleaceae bacterium]|nr:hypothetical protein [Defluviitaleaceae bacterium]
MKNIHATDGMSEDIIRSFVQLATLEMHMKTLLEKRVSELENGMLEETEIEQQIETITALETDLHAIADIRRGDMLYLYEMYGSVGDKEQWCSVKHLAIAMMTSFEAWQASKQDDYLLMTALKKNRYFIKALSTFLGVELTECAACFADILKINEEY